MYEHYISIALRFQCQALCLPANPSTDLCLTFCILFFRGLEGDKPPPLPLMLHSSVCTDVKRREESLATSPSSCLSCHGGD